MRQILLLLLTLACASCTTPPDPPHALLASFVDSYIHHADPNAARQWAAGDALTKLDGEIAAVSGQERPSSGPDVDFSIVDEHAAHDSMTFELELKIKSSGTPAFTRDLLVTGAEVNGVWKVVDYFFLK